MNKSNNPVWTTDESNAVMNAFAVIRADYPTKPMSKVTLEAQKILPKKRRLSMTGIYAFNSANKEPLNEFLQIVKPGASIKAVSGTLEATSTNPSEVSATETVPSVEATAEASPAQAKHRRGTTLWKPAIVTKLLKQAVLIAKSSEADSKLPLVTLIAMAQVQVLDADLHRTTKAISAWKYENKPAIVEEFLNLSYAYDKREEMKVAAAKVEEFKATKEVIVIPGPKVGNEFFELFSKFGKEFDALVATKKAEFNTHAEIKGEQVFHSKVKELDAFMAAGADKMMDSIPMFIKRSVDEHMLNVGVAKASSKLKLVAPSKKPEARKPTLISIGGTYKDATALQSALSNYVSIQSIGNGGNSGTNQIDFVTEEAKHTISNADVVLVFPCFMSRKTYAMVDACKHVIYLDSANFSEHIPEILALSDTSKAA